MTAGDCQRDTGPEMSPSSPMKVLQPYCMPCRFQAPPGLERLRRLPGDASPPAPPPEILEDARSKVVAAVRTKEGAELTCSQFARLGGATLDAFCWDLVAAMLPQLPRLCCDAQASQVITSLMSLPGLAPDLRRRLFGGLAGSLLKLTRDKRGCWVVQRALEKGAAAELCAAFETELAGKVLLCSQHLHGNFVVQKCVELLPPQASAFIARELKECVLEAASDVYSCRVLQRLMEHGQGSDMDELLTHLLRPECVERLAFDAYGHNVLRALLAHGSCEQVQRMAQILCAQDCGLLVYARNRHASLVLDQALETLFERQELQEERAEVMQRLLSGQPSVLLQVALDRFGNYIAQRAIAGSLESEREQILELLAALGARLRRSANGRHICTAARRRFGAAVAEALRKPELKPE
ncbi:unnamed protein product [Effrenium voratum]|nr:unnamed protein product [Effrenium voratum]